MKRVGKRKQPHYRVVIADQRSPRDGRFIEAIGQYNPMTNPSEITVDGEKALEWLRKGAKPSDSVIALLKRTGIWSTFVADKGPAPKKPKKHKETAKIEAAKAQAAEAKNAKAEAAEAKPEPAAAPPPAAPEEVAAEAPEVPENVTAESAESTEA